MKNICTLSTAYWPNIQYLSKIYQHSEFLIEKFETYPKQTYRNRCELYSANGKISIQVPVQKGSFTNVLIKDLQIAYDTNWQKNHLKTIESAYRSTPFFEYYFDDLLPYYQTKLENLFDYNTQILKTCFEWLDIDKEINFTTDFYKDIEVTDYRNAFNPKSNKQTFDKAFKAKEYIQGFEQRHGFIPNLSVLDLVFNLGPESSGIIIKSIYNESTLD